MLVASREAPDCATPSLVERDVTETVRLPLPEAAAQAAVGSKLFIACPPGSFYEMIALEEKVSSTLKPSFLSAASPTIRGALTATKPADWDEEEDGQWEAAPETDVEDDSIASADPVKEAQRVEEELATHTPQDSIAFLAHCESKLAAGEPCACCSPTMMESLRNKVAAEGAADSETTATATSNASGATELRMATVAVEASGASSDAQMLSF